MGSIEGFSFGAQLADGGGEDPTMIRRRKARGYEYHRQQVLKTKKKARDFDRDLTPPLLGLAIGDFLSVLTEACEQITKKFRTKFGSDKTINAELSLLLLTVTAIYFKEKLPNNTSDYRDVLDERILNALSMGSRETLVKILGSRVPGSIEKVSSLGLPKVTETSSEVDDES
jgi:hypothetical protein